MRALYGNRIVAYVSDFTGVATVPVLWGDDWNRSQRFLCSAGIHGDPLVRKADGLNGRDHSGGYGSGDYDHDAYRQSIDSDPRLEILIHYGGSGGNHMRCRSGAIIEKSCPRGPAG